jgi:hypothetical protein
MFTQVRNAFIGTALLAAATAWSADARADRVTFFSECTCIYRWGDDTWDLQKIIWRRAQRPGPGHEITKFSERALFFFDSAPACEEKLHNLPADISCDRISEKRSL